MFFDWKIQLEKIQLTQNLKDDALIHQGIRIPCKNDKEYFDPTTRTQATIVWFPEDTCTTFQVARMIKFLQQYFFESIPYDEVNPEKYQTKQSIHKIFNNLEIKLTSFQIYPETELAFKNNTPIYKTQYAEILVEYEKGFDMNTRNLKIIPDLLDHVSKNDKNSYIPVTILKNAGRGGRKLRPQDKINTRLQVLLLIKNTYFGAIHYEIHLDMKLDYTISRIFQKVSLSELETLHHLCELERTQILQSLAFAVLNFSLCRIITIRNWIKFY